MKPKLVFEEPVTGWTTPSIIYDRMRDIDTAASALDREIQTKVTRAAFRDHWGEWYKRWRAFFAKYQGAWAKLGAVTYTDDLASQVESWRQQLADFGDAYKLESGSSVPGIPPSPPVPPPPLPNPTGIANLSVPWWVWMLGGVALVGTGYYLYTRFQDMRAKKHAVEGAMPSLLSAYGVPPQLAAASVAHDPNPSAPPFIYDAQGTLYRKV